MESNHVENIRNWKTKQTTKRNSPSTNAYRLHGQLGYIMPLKRQASVYLYKRKQSNEMFWDMQGGWTTLRRYFTCVSCLKYSLFFAAQCDFSLYQHINIDMHAWVITIIKIPLVKVYNTYRFCFLIILRDRGDATFWFQMVLIVEVNQQNK